MQARAKHWLMLLAVSLVILAAPVPAAAQVEAANCEEIAGLTHRIAVCIRTTIDNGAALYFGRVTSFFERATMAAITLAVLIYGVMLSFGMVEKVGRDTFVLLFKVSAVVFLVANSPLIFRTTINIMDGMALAVTRFIPPSGTVDADSSSDFARVHCLQLVSREAGRGGNPAPAAAPWLGVDCLLDTIVGIRIPTCEGGEDPGDNACNAPPTFDAIFYNERLDNANPDETNRGLARGLVNFFTSNLQSSVVGLVLGVIGIVFVFGMLMLVIRAFFTYIAAYMGIALLVIVSPLIIPLILFKETKQYFDKWVKLMISFALQPVIMLVLIIFTITAVDLAVFSGRYSIMYRIAGEASRADNFDLNDYLTTPRTPTGEECTPPVCMVHPCPIPTCRPIIEEMPRSLALIKSLNPERLGTTSIVGEDQGGIAHRLRYSECTAENIRADTTGELARRCNYTYPISVWLQEVRWDHMASMRDPAVDVPGDYPEVLDAEGNPSETLRAGQYLLREVLAACFLCGVVIFVMNGMVRIVPRITSDLLGDAMQTPDLAGQVAGNLGRQTSSSMQQTLGRLGRP